MRTESITQEDFSSSIKCMSPWRLVKVEPLSNYRLEVVFVDGTSGIVDLHALIHSQKAGIFAQLKELNLFNSVYILLGVVTWPGEIDLSPDAMYEHIRKDGCWIIKS